MSSCLQFYICAETNLSDNPTFYLQVSLVLRCRCAQFPSTTFQSCYNRKIHWNQFALKINVCIFVAFILAPIQKCPCLVMVSREFELCFLLFGFSSCFCLWFSIDPTIYSYMSLFCFTKCVSHTNSDVANLFWL